MSKRAILALLVGGLFLIAGCSSMKASSNAEERTSTPTSAPPSQDIVLPEPTVTPSPQPSQGTTVHPATSQCNLLDSRDVAQLYSSAEHTGPVNTVGQVNHTIFSTETISATESSCVFYVFYPPGQKHQQMLQVTYWLDLPNQAAAGAWAQVWADARSKAAQAAPGVGDDAFYDNGRLTFKQGSAYVTIEIVGTNLNTDTNAGVSQQMQMEKQIALDAQSRLDTAKNSLP